ncbi:MAG: DegT/DnrJ/EryC1/StrS family aminotransferase [Actinomycetota bacterium]|nr:DegT/DnrJ/EryC1/StrS family aminotransferase [Actinomycetota bacterium]
MPSAVIPLDRPEVGDAEVRALRRVLDSGWLTQGPEVAAFEEELAEVVGAPVACAVSSGSAALLLALGAVGAGRGAEVVTVSHSFIATADAIRMTGATPVFIDIDPASSNMDPALLGPAISARTVAVVCVHQMGMPADLAAILPIAAEHGVAVIEDAACAVGSEILWGDRWEPIGRPHGMAACFSFHPRKLVTTGDGGMVTTGDAGFDRQVRGARAHGMSVAAHARHEADKVTFETYDRPGFNFRLTDLQAAVGRVQLGRLAGSVQRRRVLAGRYHRLLAEIPTVGVAVEPPWARSNWQSYGVRLAEGLDQRTVMQGLLDRGVASRRAVMCAHRERAYPPGSWRAGSELSHSEAAQDRGVLLPLYPQMSHADQDLVVEALGAVCSR